MPAAGTAAPMIVPSILPPVISAPPVVIAENVPAAGTAAPTIVPSIVPPLISAPPVVIAENVPAAGAAAPIDCAIDITTININCG